jgi:hypothetical protein
MRPLRTNGARLAALLLALGLAGPAWCQDEGPFGDPDQRQEQLEPPLGLPQSLREIIRPGAGEPAPSRIDKLRDVGRAMQACWKPTGTPHSGQEVTVRVSFKRNGEVLGQPRITHYHAGRQGENGQDFIQAVRDALVRCSPMPFSPSLGAAIAGRPFAFRFVDAPAPMLIASGRLTPQIQRQ